MKKLNKYWILGFALALGLSACNLPTSSVPNSLSLEEQAGTLAAQTVSAAQTQMPTQTRLPANTPTLARPSKTSAPPTASPTSTAAPHPLNPPSLKKYDFSCSWNGTNTELQMIIQWTDKSDNEQGFIVLRDGTEIANLLPNATNYTDIFAVNTGQLVNYAVAAYNNESGESEAITLSTTCN
ncbi:MAG: hypothetical protein HN736_07565 [Anaerolineae bacterium]|jgi:hypothetical protein|nr:hypothetical protein [Anaerolineae bacterium]MBT4311509.1 hypothetical protein [Anaerolineae bacterium]MBT4456783.1 hypothetical protein [Anaerolineae bacterium]MBT6062772.1 hypothetical protein [Anaerolineae bacterium]MBT6321160.1 hypothetical protein [Anaerolineae bacterium]